MARGFAGRRETTVRPERERLHALLGLHEVALDTMAHGLCMYDAQHRVVLYNRCFLEIYGLDPHAVRAGMSAEAVFRRCADSIGLAKPVAVALWLTRKAQLERGKPFRQRQRLPDERTIAVKYRPLTGGGWVSVYEDTSEAERLAAELRRQFDRMQQAIGSMLHGLCMFDAQERLIVCNARYLELYDLDPAVAQPGILHADLLRHWIERGNRAGMPAEEFYAARTQLSNSAGATVARFRRRDGRIIEATSRPTPGGGWVSAHEDVTERLQQEAALREQNLRFDAALNNMSQGLVMVDENMRVTVCNRRYREIFGMSPDVVKPGVSMREVIEYSVSLGNYPGHSGENRYAIYLERLRSGGSYERYLADGRVIHITHRRMAQGGYVVTYEDITERHRAEERIAHMARHDALTGLANRVLFREKMAEGLARVASEGKGLGLLCLDLDNFKTVNDTLGHPIGDRMLSAVAHLLLCVLGPEETIARLGGDEFAILTDKAEPRAVEVLARRIVEVLDQPIMVEGHEINTGVSIGVALAPHDGKSADYLMKCADLALYRAKAEGRGRFRFFEADMDTRVQERRALELDLRKALTAGEFALFFQPLVSARDNALTGMEALLRWNHPVRGRVSPAEFIPLAEETGLIVPLGEWVLRQACAEAARWPAAIKVAVNLSPVQFKNRALVGTVASALAASGLAPARLELEITEAVMLRADDLTVAMLHQLRGLGVRVSMDDFGTGYSSLSYLRSFPFDKIKIDRCFIADLGQGEDSAAIVRAIAGLGASLGMDVTAEGVETAAQWEQVRREGCTEMQGHYFSAPRPAGEAFELIARWTARRAVA